MKTAFLLGGSGQTGRALVPRLAERGWSVTVASRGERPVTHELRDRARIVQFDRDDDEALRSALGDGADVLVDFIAFERRHAEQLLALGESVGSLIVVSSSSVYADGKGRTLDEATGPADFPELRVPITERQRTVEAGDATYSTKKVAIERRLLDQDRVPTTIIRPGAIHGAGGILPREWYFVKRALDRRKYVVLADRGAGRFHTTSTENLAELLLLAAARPGTRVLNCGDPEPPTVLEISRAIASAMEIEWAEVLLANPAADGEIGLTPWSVPRPFVLDMTEAEVVLGYRAVTSYAESAPATCRWVVEATEGHDWRDLLTGRSADLWLGNFGYEAEDEFLSSLTGD